MSVVSMRARLQAWLGQQADQAPIAGVVFGDTAVSVAVMSAHHGRMDLLDFAVSPCVDAIDQGKIVDKSALANALSTAMSQLSVLPSHAACSVVEELVMHRMIELPVWLDDTAIEAAILLDAEQYIGQSLDDVYIDFTCLEIVGEIQRIRLTIAHRQAVDDCTEVLAMAGLQTVAIETGALSWARALSIFMPMTESVALVEIGRDQSALTIIDGEKITHRTLEFFGTDTVKVAEHQAENAATDQPIDEMISDDKPAATLDFYAFLNNTKTQTDTEQATVTQSSADTKSTNEHAADHQSTDTDPSNFITATTTEPYTISFDDAVITHPSDVRQNIDQTMLDDVPNDHTINQLQTQITAMLNTYQTHQAALPKRIIIAGVSQVYLALIDKLNAQTDSTVMFAAAPQIAMPMQAQAVVPLLLPAMALSLHHSPLNTHKAINLLPWRDEARALQDQTFKKKFTLILITAAAVLLGVFAVLVYLTHQQTAVNDAIGTRIEQNQDKLRTIKQLEQQNRTAKAQLAAMNLWGQDHQTLGIWQNLPNLVPTGVYLDGLRQTNDEITIQGMAKDAAQVSVFASQLEMSGQFTQVLVTAIQSVDTVVRFTMTAKHSTPVMDALSDENMPSDNDVIDKEN